MQGPFSLQEGGTELTQVPAGEPAPILQLQRGTKPLWRLEGLSHAAGENGLPTSHDCKGEQLGQRLGLHRGSGRHTGPLGWEAAATDPQHSFPHALQVGVQCVINLGQSKSKARCQAHAGAPQGPSAQLTGLGPGSLSTAPARHRQMMQFFCWVSLPKAGEPWPRHISPRGIGTQSCRSFTLLGLLCRFWGSCCTQLLRQAALAVRDQGWGCRHDPLPPSLQRVKCQFQVSLR